jgi:Holliday junction resolvase
MASEITPETLKKLAYSLQPYTFPRGESQVPTEGLISRVKAIRKGLSAEREFRTIVSWLGKCGGIYTIDQTPMPAQFTDLQLSVPDFIAFAKLGETTKTFLVEVKSSEEGTLVWSEKYIRSLQAFADLLRVPLLIAWKWKVRWVVVDASVFEKKVTAHHLTAEKALQQNLMPAVFGDVAHALREDFQMVIDATVQDYEPRPEDKLLPEGAYTFKLQEMYFRVHNKRQSGIPNELVWLFFSFPQESVVNRRGGREVEIVHSPQPNTYACLSDALMAALLWRCSPEEALDWDRVIQEGDLPDGGPRLTSALNSGIEQGFVRYVLDQVPETKPPYLA